MLRKIWDRRLSIFIVVFFLYSIPFITSPLRIRIFDFLWEDWGWNIGYYIAGEVILLLIMGILALTGHFEPEEKNNNVH